MKHHFLWLDLETTGLDPAKCRILEWAAVLAADGRDGDMSVVESFSDVVGFGCADEGGDFSGLRAAQAEMGAFATAMHERNGLIAECINSTATIADADQFLTDLCEAQGWGPRSVILAGATVHFDQSFVRAHMPKLAALLSHRVFDVSTLKAAERDWAGEPFAKAEAHRALPDIIESLEQAAQIRKRVPRWNQ